METTFLKLLPRFFEIPIYKQKTVDKRVNIFLQVFLLCNSFIINVL